MKAWDLIARRVGRGADGQEQSEALRNSEFIYCEGYACGIIPLEHAWVVDPQGNVIDPTWRKLGVQYFGIAFKRNYLFKALLRQKHYGLIDSWMEHWPLLYAPRNQWKHPINQVSEKSVLTNSTTTP